ncbi:hypothetical protein ABFX02_07G008500 [Erythranthe guttata]
MLFSAFNNQWLLLSILFYVFVSACKFGIAYDYPHLGAAGVVADQYLPQAEVEGGADQSFPQTGIIGTTPALIFNKALECLSNKYIYSSCDEAHRLTQNGELNVPPEYADEYCNGPCLAETNHALDCINGILKRFVFYNSATLNDVRETIKSGCGYGPKRGNFDVIGHIQAGDASKNRVFDRVVYVVLAMTVAWRVLL